MYRCPRVPPAARGGGPPAGWRSRPRPGGAAWWREQIEYWTGINWNGEIRIAACTGTSSDGWIQVEATTRTTEEQDESRNDPTPPHEPRGTHSEPQARMDWEAEADDHPAGRRDRKADHDHRRDRRVDRRRRYQVEVIDNGYRFDGKTYPSLTTIAKRITGTHWSGPRFFGLTPKRKA